MADERLVELEVCLARRIPRTQACASAWTINAAMRTGASSGRHGSASGRTQLHVALTAEVGWS